MQFLNRVKNFFSGQSEEEQTDSGEAANRPSSSRGSATQPGGFSAKRQVAVPRQPLLQNAGYGAAGGVQGLEWYKAGLKRDNDGDLADEFLLESSLSGNADPQGEPLKVQKRNITHAALGDAAMFVDQGQVFVLPAERKPR